MCVCSGRGGGSLCGLVDMVKRRNGRKGAGHLLPPVLFFFFFFVPTTTTTTDMVAAQSEITADGANTYTRPHPPPPFSSPRFLPPSSSLCLCLPRNFYRTAGGDERSRRRGRTTQLQIVARHFLSPTTLRGSGNDKTKQRQRQQQPLAGSWLTFPRTSQG